MIEGGKDWVVGQLVRYDHGKTALMRISSFSAGSAYGEQCMGGSVGASLHKLSIASMDDLHVWQENAHWRNTNEVKQHAAEQAKQAADRQQEQEKFINKISEAVSLTLKSRGGRYGDYSFMSIVAQRIKGAMQEAPGWPSLRPCQRESLDLIATKIARIVCGNPEQADSWLDIEGYARLSRERLGVSGGCDGAVGGNTLTGARNL